MISYSRSIAATSLHALRSNLAHQVSSERDKSNLKKQKRELMGIIGEQRNTMEASAIGKESTELLEEQFESKAPLLGKCTGLEEELEEVCSSHVHAFM